MTVPALRPSTEKAVETTGDMTADRRAKRRWRPSILATLTFGFGILVSAAVLSVLWFSLDAASKNTFALLRETAEMAVDSVIGSIDQHLGAARNQAEYLARMISRGDLDPSDRKQMEDVLLGSLAAVPQVSGIAFISDDLQATRVGRVPGGFMRRHSSWSDRPEIRRWIATMRKQHHSSWSPVLWISDLQVPSITVDVPVRVDGRFIGVVASVVSVSGISRFLSESDEAYDTHSFILYGRDRVLAHASLAGGTRGLSEEKPLPNLGEVNDRVLAAIWQKSRDDMPNLLAGSPVQGRVVEAPDDEYIYLYRVVEGYGPEPWYVGLHFLSSETDKPLRRLFIALAAGLGILIVSVLLAIILGRAIARPIRRLADAALAVRRFDLANVPPLEGGPFRELDNAAQAYDSMLTGLRWFETYVPKALVLRLMRLDAAASRSEERTVTVLFTDIVGFTGLSGRQQPAELADFLNQHFALLGNAIEAEQGTVDKYIGDSVMAFWGAPLEQPHHAMQACRAALAIAASVEADNERRRTAGQAPVGVRIGVHSGPTLVGNIGAPGRINYTLVGDTVNVAQRLEGLGKDYPPADGTTVILISGETASLLDPGFKLDPLGSRQLRGRSEHTDVFRLTGYEPQGDARVGA